MFCLHINVRVFFAQDDRALGHWLTSRFAEKEKMLKEFYRESNGCHFFGSAPVWNSAARTLRLRFASVLVAYAVVTFLCIKAALLWPAGALVYLFLFFFVYFVVDSTCGGVDGLEFKLFGNGKSTVAKTK